MARNEEKAMTLFSKWDTFKTQYNAGTVGNKRRPFLASECTTLTEAEKWRRELVKEITLKVSQIQNAGLGEARLRELNDEINKLNRTKFHWDKRVAELGGGDGRQKTYIDVDGKELPGAPGYKYYGAAKDLPGVRELFQQSKDEAEKRSKKRSRGDMYRFVTPDYYGYRDDDDGLLAPQEAAREKVLVAQAVRAREEKKKELREEVQRSGGHFGAAQLAVLEAAEKDDEKVGEVEALARACDQVARAAMAGLGSDTTAGAAPDAKSTLLIDAKKQKLLSQFL